MRASSPRMPTPTPMISFSALVIVADFSTPLSRKAAVSHSGVISAIVVGMSRPMCSSHPQKRMRGILQLWGRRSHRVHDFGADVGNDKCYDGQPEADTREDREHVAAGVVAFGDRAPPDVDHRQPERDGEEPDPRPKVDEPQPG